MIISVALPHIYLVASEPSSFAVCSRSQYYFPSNYTVWSPRFSRGNWLGQVTAGWGGIASISSLAGCAQPCSDRARSASPGDRAIQAPPAVFLGGNGQGWSVWGVGDTSSHTQVGAGGFISLVRGLRAATIWFVPQQVVCAINHI